MLLKICKISSPTKKLVYTFIIRLKMFFVNVRHFSQKLNEFYENKLHIICSLKILFIFFDTQKGCNLNAL